MTTSDNPYALPEPDSPQRGDGLWVPPSAKGRSFTVRGFGGEDSPDFKMTEVGDIQFTTDYVIFFGLDGNIIARHHTDIRGIDETTDRTPAPTPARPTKVEL